MGIVGAPGTYTIGTLNVAGLKSPKSQDKFEILQQKKLDILVLQETNCSAGLEKEWRTTFYPKKSYWTKDCAFIIDPKIPHSNFRPHLNNRLILLDIVLNEVPITLIGMHAPNKYTDRIQFFNNVTNLKFNKENILLGGDLNQIENPSLDRFPPQQHT